MLSPAVSTSHSLSTSTTSSLLYRPPQARQFSHPSYPLPMDPSAVDFRAFYPYTPNEVKHRKRTTSAQLKILESVFKCDTKPNAALRTELAAQLDMTARGVQVWFQNRRAKEKNKAGKSAAATARDMDEPREPIGSIESILLPQSTFPRDLPELGDSSSQESSPTGTSPPQLHVNIDPSIPSWQSSPLITPDDSRLSGELDMCFIRRGSLPVDAFYNDDGSAVGPPSVGHFDPFARRRSVDASLHRLAANPFANLARAKNSGFSASRFPGHVNFSLSRSSSASSDFTSHPPMPHHLGGMHVRRSSADSRAYRLSPHGVPVSPSPSPMSAYHSSIRTSLPDTRLYAFSTRPISSPLPGPLPSPDYSFGNASSITSLTSPDSERNSPDYSHGLLFRGEDLDAEDDAASASYGGYSRFGSITSITSDSSNSAYYSDVSNCVDPSSGGPDASHHRRDSGHFAGLMSDLNVGGLSCPSQRHTSSTSVSGERVTVSPIPVSAVELSLEGGGTNTYPSPSSTVSGSPAERNGSAKSPLPGELLQAWQNTPDVNHLSTYTSSQPLQQHSDSPVVKPEGFYLPENRFSPITLPSASIEFAGNEYHFVAHQSTQDGANFGTGTSGTGSYPVGFDAMSHEHFTNHSHNGSRDPNLPLFENGSTPFL
ncbi:hypothetical protein J3R30DRAFT_3698041 [Lentinula aciculospora]|uniref:Homeobox domain-containing protein n=1 Tax=Lentinula aciculospora TaxID=153920 RepID=A0A9W9DT91_9AGAR|nr:hypothetical protein J3R30DRAFT_3698041 [Lentinula aciculospora]